MKNYFGFALCLQAPVSSFLNDTLQPAARKAVLTYPTQASPKVSEIRSYANFHTSFLVFLLHKPLHRAGNNRYKLEQYTTFPEATVKRQ